jgi:hypothetical protein
MKTLWSWLMFAASLTCWPIDIVWRTLLRQPVEAGRTIRYRDANGRTLTAPAWYRGDHSTLSPNLFRLGAEAATIAALLAVALAGVLMFLSFGGIFYAAPWHAWVAWSVLCGLAVPFSDAQFLHDYAYDQGVWDNGTPMFKGEADGMMLAVLEREGHPQFVRGRYRWGIGTGIARRLWNAHKDGRIRAVE